MPLTRRSMLKNLGVGAAGMYASSLVSTRWQESIAFAAETSLPLETVINLHNNENPLGPGQPVLDAIDGGLGSDGAKTGRYPFAYGDALHEAIAAKFGVKPENVLIGAGSTQILVDATHVYTSKEKALVGSLPTYEECFGYARFMGHRSKAVPLTSEFRMDLDQALHACKGGGLLFYCNPNNPAASIVAPSDTKEFIPRVLKATSDLHILADEAYFDYVTTPGHETLIPMAVQEPRLIVSRTFSKAYGMAGLRVGYAIAHEKTIEELEKFHMTLGVSGLSYAAAIGALERDQKDPSFITNERARNRKARDYTRNWFHERGYKDTDSQANFLFVDVQMPVEDFQAGCREHGVRVGRPFPPLWTHCRISIGTLEQMQRATKVFEKVLGARAKAAA